MNLSEYPLVEQFVIAVPLVVMVFVFMFVAKSIRDARTDFDDNYEIEVKSNLAVGISTAGLFLGLVIGMGGALTGVSQGIVADLIQTAIEGAIVMVVLIAAQVFNDKVILRHLNNFDELKRGNTAVAFVQAGAYIATGLVLFGAFSGQGGGLASALVFALFGQVALLVFYQVYQLVTKFDVSREIKNANTAAGLAVAGMLVALGLILRASIAGDFESWGKDLTSFGITVVGGMIILLLARVAVDKVFLPHTTLQIEIERDGNVAAITLSSSVLIAIAFVVSTVL